MALPWGPNGDIGVHSGRHQMMIQAQARGVFSSPNNSAFLKHASQEFQTHPLMFGFNLSRPCLQLLAAPVCVVLLCRPPGVVLAASKTQRI